MNRNHFSQRWYTMKISYYSCSELERAFVKSWLAHQIDFDVQKCLWTAHCGESCSFSHRNGPLWKYHTGRKLGHFFCNSWLAHHFYVGIFFCKVQRIVHVEGNLFSHKCYSTKFSYEEWSFVTQIVCIWTADAIYLYQTVT